MTLPWQLQRREEALADTNASLELVATSYKALRTRARISMASEDYQAAVTDFKASLEQVQIEGSQTEERALRQELKEAEIALRRSKSKDYYKILGLSVTSWRQIALTAGSKDIQKDSTEHDIKKAYRKQSLLHHPDKASPSRAQAQLNVPADAVQTLGWRRRKVQARRGGVQCAFGPPEARTVRPPCFVSRRLTDSCAGMTPAKTTRTEREAWGA